MAIAISPATGAGGYGSSGTHDGATTIALTQCSLHSPACLIADTTHYGCVAYAYDPATQAWAGGVGPDDQAAVNDAAGHMPAGVQLTGGSHCSIPVTPP